MLYIVKLAQTNSSKWLHRNVFSMSGLKHKVFSRR